jgi:hypothetical protein
LSVFRKHQKQWTSNKVTKKMVLGSDVGLEDTCRLALCALVGRFAYGHLCSEKTPAWSERTWSPVLGYSPELLHLSKGWWGVICRSPEDVETLLTNRWMNGGIVALCLKNGEWLSTLRHSTSLFDISGYCYQVCLSTFGMKGH